MANQSNLRDFVKYLQSTMESDPPIASGVGAKMSYHAPSAADQQLFNNVGSQPSAHGAFNPSAMKQQPNYF